MPLALDWSQISDRRWLVKRLAAKPWERDARGRFACRERFFQDSESILRSPTVKSASDVAAEPEPLRNLDARTPIG